MTAHIRRKIYFIPDLKANILVKTNIMTLEQFVLDFNKKTAFIESCFYEFNLDIKILRQFVQQLIHIKTEATILSHIKVIILIYH